MALNDTSFRKRIPVANALAQIEAMEVLSQEDFKKCDTFDVLALAVAASIIKQEYLKLIKRSKS